MPKKPKLPSIPNNISPGVSSTVRNVSNTGQMSTSSVSTGAKGGAVNNTVTYSSKGADGAAGVTVNASVQSGHTPGPWNWMDDHIQNLIKNWPRS